MESTLLTIHILFCVCLLDLDGSGEFPGRESNWDEDKLGRDKGYCSADGSPFEALHSEEDSKNFFTNEDETKSTGRESEVSEGITSNFVAV